MEDSVFIHEKAIVEPGASIGSGTRVWGFVHILSGASIGRECNICDHVFIENDVIIGDRVTVKCGNYIWDGVRIEDSCFLGPSVVFANDKFPRSKQYLDRYLPTIVHKGASIGANATLLPGITIGEWAMIGAGSVVTSDVAPFTLVFGNPAQKIGYVCVCGNKFRNVSQCKVVSCTCGQKYKWDGDNLREISK